MSEGTGVLGFKLGYPKALVSSGLIVMKTETVDKWQMGRLTSQSSEIEVERSTVSEFQSLDSFVTESVIKNGYSRLFRSNNMLGMVSMMLNDKKRSFRRHWNDQRGEMTSDGLRVSRILWGAHILTS